MNKKKMKDTIMIVVLSGILAIQLTGCGNASKKFRRTGFSWNEISDIRLLCNLTKLTQLNLEDNDKTDYSLAELVKSYQSRCLRQESSTSVRLKHQQYYSDI